jgi:hypothetical protein
MNKLCHRVAPLLALALAAGGAGAYDDLTALSDEFDSASTVTNWQRIYQVEGWGNNALQTFDINATRPGRMMMVPHTSSWYAEWRGELAFKTVTGDFVITTDVEPRNRAGNGAPGSQYSLAGIMVRTPRTMTTPAQWTPGGQNYVFLSTGAANNPGTYQYEVKTTLNSQSTLYISNGAPARSSIQVARIGPHLILLRRAPGGAWQVHQRYFRPDMPATLQAGLTVYTDWPTCEAVGVQYQNQFVLTNGQRLPNGVTLSTCHPDLVAAFEYVRYARPVVPAVLAGADLSNAGAVSDAHLLSFLGEAANVPGGAAVAPLLSRAAYSPGTGFAMELSVVPNRSYRVQSSADFAQWITRTSFVSGGSSAVFLGSSLPPHPPVQFFRAVSP